MSEVIADLDTTVSSADGEDYYAQVAAEQRPSGAWEAWLEFVPRDDSLLTKTETTQPTRDDVVRWSETMTPIFLQGAFSRAVHAVTGRRVVRGYRRI